MLGSEFSDNLTAVALVIFATTGFVGFPILLWKSRRFVAEFKGLKIAMQTDLQGPINEVLMSVNNKHPNEPNLFQQVKEVKTDLRILQRQFSHLSTKVDGFGDELRAHSASSRQWQGELVDDLVKQLGVEIRIANRER